MKKILLTFVLLVGIVAGLFAQKLTYQAVIRDNNQQLVVNTAVKATVTITFTSGAPYQAEFNGSTNLHGLLSIEFGDESLVGRDWTGATIAVKVVNAATPSTVYVNEVPRPVSAVPYALSVDGMAIQQYLETNHYVTETQVGRQIHDSISNVVGKAHTHDNKALLDTYTQTEANLAEAVSKKHSHDNMTVLNATTAPYTDADSTKLKGIEAGAEVNVQSDWKQTDGSKDDYIKNKPSITDTVNNILTTGKYVTETTLDGRHYLTSDSTVITTMQGNITANATNITSLQSGLSAATVKEKTDSTTLAGRIDALENASMDCNDVKDCIKDTLSKYTMTDVLNGLLQQLEARLTGKIDSLAHVVDSLAKLPHGGDTPTSFICGTSKVKDVDNNEYNTVKIGNQCWMKENLRTTRYANGTSISNGGTNTSTSTAFRYFPKGDTSNVSIYGHLYNWTAVTKGASTTYPQNESDTLVHGICPDGWHVPSDAEFDTLTNYVNSVAEYRCGETDGTIANALSAATGWQNSLECGAGYSSTTLNKTGFSAVPAGYCNRDSFNGFGGEAYFWSATQNGTAAAWIRNLFSNNSHASSDNRGKFLGFSVRCLRDAGTGGGGTTPVPVEVSCEQVMECMGDTLGKLNTKIVDLNATVTTQGQKLDSLAHVVDSLAKLPHGGDTVKFTCGTDKVKDADGNEYNTVKIGNQCWMAKNLRTTTGLTENTNYWHANDQSANDETYGLLYNWAAVMQDASSSETAPSGVHGICPTGWHVPSGAEWTQLTTYVNSVADYRCEGNNDYIANALSAATGWNTPEECGAGYSSTTLNKTGFSAVPAGRNNGNFDGFGNGAYFWSATQDDDNDAWCRSLGSIDSRVSSGSYSKGYGLSVRCLKDEGGSSATLPTVTTTSVTNITHNSATSGGDVTADGGANVTARGVCWSTSQNPTIADSHTADGSGTGNFVSSITSLTSNTTYYVRAYATNSKGTAYGEEVSFTTISLPTVTTDSANTVTNNTATLHGNVTNMGGNDNVYAGFKYGTSESTLTSIVAKDAAMTATGLFSCDITGLTANTQYYFKAFVANGTDTVYGEVKNFTTAAAVFICGTDKVKDVDDNEYNTVKIGSQCWMAQNLRTTKYADSTGIELGSSTNTETAYRYNPGNSSDNVSIYGYLYNWKAVMGNSTSSNANPSGVQGVCPTGWHVPSDAEWMQLTTYVNSVEDYKCNNEDYYIANALSIATGWQGSSECGAGGNSTTLNKTGFSAVPAGYYTGGYYVSFGSEAYFWSATQNGSDKALVCYLYCGAVNVGMNVRSMGNGYSVRCLRD